ncbi:MAG: hypothetical protein Q8903_00430 [Bacteroidota bacterium]|nr:hypothetical protein [Bacteroidota bacterium]
MEIKPVGNANYFPKENAGVKSNKDENSGSNNTSVDKLELSQKAQELNKTDGKNLVKIQEKIASGFYNSDKVLDHVAKAILKDLKM